MSITGVVFAKRISTIFIVLSMSWTANGATNKKLENEVKAYKEQLRTALDKENAVWS